MTQVESKQVVEIHEYLKIFRLEDIYSVQNHFPRRWASGNFKVMQIKDVFERG